MFYATLDSEDGIIKKNANILTFTTRKDAEAYLRSSYDPLEWSVDIKSGSFSDCWIKCYDESNVDRIDLAPFILADCYVLTPGQHPGGKEWWINPKAQILVAMLN